MRLVDKRSQWRGPFVRHGYVEENFYLPFVQALLETGYRGSIGYELCSPLPVVGGRTVGIEFVDECTRLALEFIRETIAAARRVAIANPPANAGPGGPIATGRPPRDHGPSRGSSARERP